MTIDRIYQFFGAYPFLVPLVVWPLLTGAVSFGQDELKRYAPRAWDFLQHTGFDALGVIRKFWPKQMPPLPLPIFILFAFVAVAGCAAAKPIAVGVLDISDAVCDQVEDDGKPDSAWVTFSCTLIDVGQGVAHVFKARVKREDAPTFAARRCPQEGGVAP